MDPLKSTSRLLTPDIAGPEHCDVARRVRELLQSYNNLHKKINDSGIDVLNEEEKKIVARARRVQKFLSQPFTMSEVLILSILTLFNYLLSNF